MMCLPYCNTFCHRSVAMHGVLSSRRRNARRAPLMSVDRVAGDGEMGVVP